MISDRLRLIMVNCQPISRSGSHVRSNALFVKMANWATSSNSTSVTSLGRRRNAHLIIRLSVLLLLLAPPPSVALHIQRLTKQEFQASPILNEPIVIESALDWTQCDGWMNHILTRSGNEMMNLHETKSNIRQLSLKEAVSLVAESSSHHNPVYASSRGGSCSTDQLPTYDLIDSIIENDDFLPLFSLHAPIADTLTIAGAGASSSLECHETSRYSLSLDGNQLWRLMPPNNSTTTMGRSEQLQEMTWDGLPFSVGRHSKGGLFEFRHNEVNEKLASDDYKDDYEKFAWLADNSDMFRPNVVFDEEFSSTVTLMGDLLVIPPGWFSQMYSLESNVSLLSRRCDDLNRFCRHILSEAKHDKNAVSLHDSYTRETAQETIDSIFALLTKVDEGHE